MGFRSLGLGFRVNSAIGNNFINSHISIVNFPPVDHGVYEDQVERGESGFLSRRR